MSKLLNENTIASFMKHAGLEEHSKKFLKENKDVQEENEDVQEENKDVTEEGEDVHLPAVVSMARAYLHNSRKTFKLSKTKEKQKL